MILAGCLQKPDDPEVMEIKNAVRKYNRALIEAYETFNIGVLEPTATEKESKKVDVLAMALKAQNLRMRARLESLRFTGAEKISETSATVRTREEWTYSHEDIGTGKPSKEGQKTSYALVYSVLRTPEGWKVDSVEAH